jgi:H+-transporting ATPase
MKPNGDKPDLKSLPMPELQAKLGSSPDGLSQAEAQKRLTQYGPNEIEEKKTNPFLKFLTYFWGPIPWMIEGAVILSGVTRPATPSLPVAGHLTIFLTRTRGPFWSIRPARILWAAVLGTQTVATLIAVYGLFMTPLGWGWALFVWS